MNKFTPIAIVALVIIVAAAILFMPAAQTTQLGYNNFSVNGNSFAITYVQTTQAQWEQGLMNKTVTNSTIMLFVFPKLDYYTFWMFDTDYNLDMLWVNATGAGGRIVYIASNATSCFVASECAQYMPNKEANYVIEARAGFVKRNNINTGQFLTFN